MLAIVAAERTSTGDYTRIGMVQLGCYARINVHLTLASRALH